MNDKKNLMSEATSTGNGYVREQRPDPNNVKTLAVMVSMTQD